MENHRVGLCNACSTEETGRPCRILMGGYCRVGSNLRSGFPTLTAAVAGTQIRCRFS